MGNEILVIIPCLNEEKTIAALAQQLERASKTCPMQIVIADGGSSDKTVAIAKKLAEQHTNITYLHNPKRIQSAAVNLAVATYGKDKEFLIRLDAHAEYPNDYCQILLEEAKSSQAASIVVTMDTQGHKPFQRAVAAAQNSKLGNGGSSHRSTITVGRWVDHGHHALIRIDAFTKIGGYDENFSHNEDAEMDTRLTKAGYKIWLTARTKLVYTPRSSPIRLCRQYFHYGRGRVRNIVKHKTQPKLRQMIPAVVLPAFVLMLLAPFCWILSIPFLAWVMLCVIYGTWLTYRTEDFALVLSGPAAMMMHFSWSLGFWSGVKQVIWSKK